MASIEERLKKIEYHQRLLLRMMQGHAFPFFQLVIENGLSEEDVQDLINLCEELTRLMEEQKQAGYVSFTPLLTHFAGMLNPKLHPTKVIVALDEQNMYRPLMKVFLDELNKGIEGP